MDNKFVSIKNELKINNVIIKQYEIGYVKEIKNNLLSVYFIVEDVTIDISKNQIEHFNPLETGDLFSKKVCNVCHRLLDTNMFSKNQLQKNDRPIRRPSCIDCRKIIDGVNANNKEKVKWNKEKPHLIPFECPICNKRTIPGLTSKVVLDHDHITGNIRGWICKSCNTGIGRFKDNTDILKNAINFIENN